jgi:phosphatidylglycerol lysyltransferase
MADAKRSDARGLGILKPLGMAVGVLVFGLSLWLLYRELRSFHPREIAAAIRGLPLRSIALALAATVASYLAASGYDWLAVRYARHPLGWRKTVQATVAGIGVGNATGFGVLTSGSVRYRFYSSWGFSGTEIARVIGFCTLSLWIGFLSLGGLFFTIESIDLPAMLHVPFLSVRPLGIAFLAAVAAYALLALLLRRRELRIGRASFALPTPGYLPLQILVAAGDWMGASFALYAVLSARVTIPWPQFMVLYVLALIAGVVSQVPGGLGVFETVFVVVLSGRAAAPTVLGAILVYRAIFDLLPLAAGLLVLLARELAERRALLAKAGRLVARIGEIAVAPLLTAVLFLGGIVLLFSGATPSLIGRLAWLNLLLPLPLIEASHFLAASTGVLMLFVARGVWRRLDAAWLLAVVLLAAGIVLSLLKGLDWEEALALALMLALLLPCRRFFFRRSSLLGGGLSAPWLAAIAVAIIATAWLARYTYRHAEYSSELWWQFVLDGHAPRSLRALAGVGMAALVAAAANLIRTRSRTRIGTDTPDWAQVARIVASSPRASANLSFLGDKRFLFSDAGSAFLMYGAIGRDWISMGDPIGPDEEAAGLVWRFRELADRHGARAVFYEVGGRALPRYLDLGYTLLNFGEEARVPLEGFGLEGSSRRDLRYTDRRLERDGCRFELVPPAEVPALLPELRAVSDAWLAERSTREKGFAMGSFREDYVARFPVGIVRLAEAIVAFATAWITDTREELAVDLMRHTAAAPAGTMEFLFTRMMLWGSSQGYRWFNLGVAPLSGLPSHALAPLWSRAANLLYHHGGRFYNFAGLRAFKQKWDPVWDPRFIAAPRGIALPLVVTDLVALVSGGVKGIVAR